MGFGNTLVSCTIKTVVISVVLAIILIVVPGIPPHYNFQSFTITPPRKYEGWSESNRVLDNVEVYFESDGTGVESVAILGDEIFTSDWTGNIYRIKNGESSVVAKLQFPCEINQTESKEKCSMPLGMRFGPKGMLYIMDIHGGLIKLEVSTGKYEILCPQWVPINGKISWVPEDVDIAKDGTIFWTDGSTVDASFTEFYGQASGRLIKYDPSTKANTVLLEDLHFSNGICLSENEDFVLVAESATSQIRRYYLKGERAGQNDVFVDGLPGYPDNIRSNGQGGFYVAMWAPWNDDFSLNIHTLSEYPLFRKLLLRSRHLIRIVLKALKTTVPPNAYLDFAIEYVDSMIPLSKLNAIPKTAAVVELSNSGSVIGILNGTNGKCHTLSQITLDKKFAYLTSPSNNKVWRIKTQDLRQR